MTVMAVPGYTSHADSAHNLLAKMPALQGHFEALSAGSGRERQIPSYQTLMRHLGDAPDLSRHAGTSRVPLERLGHVRVRNEALVNAPPLLAAELLPSPTSERGSAPCRPRTTGQSRTYVDSPNVPAGRNPSVYRVFGVRPNDR
jgi:hypothetical protein